MKSTRTKKLNLQLTRTTRLVVSFRTFKSPAKKRKPLVRPFTANRYFKKSTGQRKPFNLKAKAEAVGAWLQSVMPFFFMTLGLSGMLYFGLQTGNTRQLERVTSFAIPAPAPREVKPELPKGLPRSEPTRISIPSVGIDNSVISVGRSDDGSMEVPALFDPVTGWYKYSPTPGEIGPSVIVGHVDTHKGPSVFWRLGQVKPGEIIEITRADSTVVKFKVEALKQFEQDNFPNAEVYGNLDHAGLRLITCGGTFNRQTGRYTQNTVVFASIVI